MTFVPASQYAETLEILPILCVDIVARNSKGEYLLVKRRNEPLKGEWWVVGGRVLKGETLEEAAIRKLKEEAGLTADKLRPLGYFEDSFDKNAFGVETLYHTVSVVFLAEVADGSQVTLDWQSSDWKFAKALPEEFRIRAFADSTDPALR